MSLCVSVPTVPSPLYIISRRVYVPGFHPVQSMFLHMYVPTVCISPPCVCPFPWMFLHIYNPPYVMSLHIYIFSVSISPPYTCPTVSMSRRVYVPPDVCLLHVYVPTMNTSHLVYVQACVYPLRTYVALCMSSPCVLSRVEDLVPRNTSLGFHLDESYLMLWFRNCALVAASLLLFAYGFLYLDRCGIVWLL